MKFTLETSILGADFLGIICPRGNYVEDKSSKRQFSSGEISRGILGGRKHFWGNCPEAIIRRQLSRGQLFAGQFSSREIINVRVKTNSKSLFVTRIISAKQGRVKLYSRNKKATDKQKQKNKQKETDKQINLKNIFSNDVTQKEKLSCLEKTLIQNSKIKAELLWIKMEQSCLNFTKTQTFPKRSTASEWKNY